MFAPADRPYPADIKHLTSLRIFAALAVVVMHYTLVLPFNVGNYTHFAAKGYLAVDFFYMLSGFIIAHVYLDQIASGSFDFRGFLIKRLARLYPLHLFIFLLVVVGTGGAWALGMLAALPPWYTWHSALSNLLLTHAWGTEHRLGFNKVSWSISAEWFAYLFVPIYAALALRVRPLPLLALSAGLFAALYAATAAFWTRPLTELTFDLGILRIIPEFLAGVALYRLGRIYRIASPRLCVMTGIAGIIIAMAHVGMPDYLIVPLFAPVILMAAERAREGREGLLTHPRMIYLGELSYALYMVHFLIMEPLFIWTVYMFDQNGGISDEVFYGLWFGMFPAALACAMFCYHFIEIPARKRIMERFLPSPAANPT